MSGSEVGECLTGSDVTGSWTGSDVKSWVTGSDVMGGSTGSDVTGCGGVGSVVSEAPSPRVRIARVAGCAAIGPELTPPFWPYRHMHTTEDIAQLPATHLPPSSWGSETSYRSSKSMVANASGCAKNADLPYFIKTTTIWFSCDLSQVDLPVLFLI